MDGNRLFSGWSPDGTQPRDRPAGAFATTHWSMVIHAGDSLSPDAATAMERLCGSYWYPLYVFVRRKGHRHEDACDLTQAFFARFLEKHYLRSVGPEKGRFRTFLLTSMTHFLTNEWDRSRAQRRGGGEPVFSLDAAAAEMRYRLEPVDHESPDRVFDRHWAETVMQVALDRLAKEFDEDRFEVLKDFLLDEKGTVSYAEAASRLGMSVSAVTSAIHRMRARFRIVLHEEVAHTVGSAEEVEEEMRSLLSALAG